MSGEMDDDDNEYDLIREGEREPPPQLRAAFAGRSRTYTDDQKLAAIKREIEMRRAVYAIRVHERKMTAEEAADGIAVMLAIAEDYEAKVGQGRFF